MTLPLGCSLSEASASSSISTGKERDTESGNDYFGARYYSSTMGLFLSPDWAAKAEPVPYAKLGDPQSLNLYAYVRNNPLINLDEDGHCVEGDDGRCSTAWAAQEALQSGGDVAQAMSTSRLAQQAEQSNRDRRKLSLKEQDDASGAQSFQERQASSVFDPRWERPLRSEH